MSYVRWDTIRYDTLYLRGPKTSQSQLNMPHGTKRKKTVMKKNYNKQEGQHPLTGQRAPPISGGT